MTIEMPVAFPCQGESLVGILHRPSKPERVGVVIIVGGPQYRAGSHRQFTLLARYLAKQGYPVLRFDCRGMGDSSGDFPGFDMISADIEAAVDTLYEHVPEVGAVVLWGLCDAASAALLFGHTDQRIGGMILLNPWVRSEVTLAQTYLRHYYVTRLFSRNFWSKVLAGNLKPAAAASDLASTLRASTSRNAAADKPDFVTRMRDGLSAFGKPVMIVLSGKDITAAEFSAVARTPAWEPLLAEPRVTRHVMADATHTFSTSAWRDEVARHTAEWLRNIEVSSPRASA